MVTVRNFISALIGLVLLTQCTSKEVINKRTQFPSGFVSKTGNSFVGEWKYNNTIWYSSELSLNKNGSFTFHDQSCYGQRFSQGQWTFVNGLISLTSFENF
jgi:hypothetical protein